MYLNTDVWKWVHSTFFYFILTSVWFWKISEGSVHSSAKSAKTQTELNFGNPICQAPSISPPLSASYVQFAICGLDKLGKVFPCLCHVQTLSF